MGLALGQVRSDDWVEIASTAMNFTNRSEELFSNDALHNISTRTGLHRTIDIFFAGMGREYQDACVRKFPNQRRRTLDASHSRESEIHHDETGMILSVRFQCGLAGGRFGHDLNIWFNIQGRRKAHSYHEVVINHQNTYWF